MHRRVWGALPAMSRHAGSIARVISIGVAALVAQGLAPHAPPFKPRPLSAFGRSGQCEGPVWSRDNR